MYVYCGFKEKCHEITLLVIRCLSCDHNENMLEILAGPKNDSSKKIEKDYGFLVLVNDA
jgi:hypothetical protein